VEINLKITTKAEDAGYFLAQAILKELKLNRKVLWFLPGGSSMAVAVEAAKIISENPHKGLTVTLGDERYGKVGHKDSNWQQLQDKGFVLKEARLIPVLTGEDVLVTTEKFNTILTSEFQNADFKIGLFGMGRDGHIAGILPGSEAVNTEDLVYTYETPQFQRITMTEKAIEKLDEAVVFVQGEEKWEALENLEKDLSSTQQPAQVLKKIPLVTIFTDYKKI